MAKASDNVQLLLRSKMSDASVGHLLRRSAQWVQRQRLEIALDAVRKAAPATAVATTSVAAPAPILRVAMPAPPRPSQSPAQVLRCSTCERHAAEISRLTRELREAREEVEEWERNGVAVNAGIADETALVRLRRAFNFRRSHAVLLQALLHRAPQVVGREVLLNALDHHDDRNLPDTKVVDVHLVHVRQSLRAAGFPDAIQTNWGSGWSLDARTAQALREHIELAA